MGDLKWGIWLGIIEVDYVVYVRDMVCRVYMGYGLSAM